MASVERSGSEPPKKEPREKKVDASLRQYISSFGLDLNRDLLPQDISVFAAAQKLEKYIDKMKIPVATRKVDQNKTIMVEEEVTRQIPRTIYTDGRNPSDIPANSMEVEPVEQVTDLPTIMPGEWLKEEVSEPKFLKDLVGKVLLRRRWYETFREPHTSYETVTDKELVERPAPPEDEKTHTYVLLDVSGSMSSEGKEVAAKALTLAFLRRGYQERSQLYYRPFTDSMGYIRKGKTDEEFKKMTLGILREQTFAGGTDIQLALEHAAMDINNGGEFAHANILLITDGESYLHSNPLGDIKLHTIILDPKYVEDIVDRTREKFYERKDKITNGMRRLVGRDEFEYSFAPRTALEGWSKTYKTINPKEFEDPDASKDTQALEKEIIKSFPDRFPRETPEEIRSVMEQQDKVQEALDSALAMRSNMDLSPKEARQLDDVIEKLKELSNSSNNRTLYNRKLEERREKERAEERARQLAEQKAQQETEEARDTLDQMLGQTPEIDERQLQRHRPANTTFPESDITSEEARDALEKLTGQTPEVDEQSNQSQKLPRMQSHATQEQAREILDRLTGQAPEVDELQTEQGKGQTETQMQQSDGNTQPQTNSIPRPTRRDLQPDTSPTPDELSEQARQQLEQLTGKNPEVDEPIQQQNEQHRNWWQKLIERWRQRNI